MIFFFHKKLEILVTLQKSRTTNFKVGEKIEKWPKNGNDDYIIIVIQFLNGETDEAREE